MSRGENPRMKAVLDLAQTVDIVIIGGRWPISRGGRAMSHRPCLDSRTAVYHDGIAVSGQGGDFDESETIVRGRKRGRDGELRDACRSVGCYRYRGAARILR
jgi:hypothetical protein